MKPPAYVEVPRALRKRPRDRRGYPIPWIVLIDRAKRPHFTINNGERTVECGRKKLCGLCGDKLRGDVAFVGGPVCFLSETGAFSDPPMHAECARYAIRVCPYLAAPSYARRIDDRTLDQSKTPGGMLIGKDQLVREDRPSAFMLGIAEAFEMIIRTDGAPMFFARQRWRSLETWKAGVFLTGLEEDEALDEDRRRWPPGTY